MLDVDTFLTTLYVLVDEIDKRDMLDQDQPPQEALDRWTPHLPGPAPALSRSEVVTLAIFGQWAQFGSERAFYRYAERHLRPAFPTLPTRSQYNRLLRHSQTLLVRVGQQVAAWLTPQPSAYEILDSTGAAVRNNARRGRGWLAGAADRGYCTRLGWYVGLHVLTVVTAEGALSGFGAAPASTADQWLAETLLAARQTPQARLPEAGCACGGGYYLADTGFEGKRWWPRWLHAYHAHVLLPPKRSQPFPQPWPQPMRRDFASARQIIETVHERLLNWFGLERERPHTLAGFRARLAARAALHNVCCWLNHLAGRPLLAIADLLDW